MLVHLFARSIRWMDEHRTGIRHTLKARVRNVEMDTVQQIKTSELRYRRLFEAAQDGILILDAQSGAITDVNPFLVKMLGYARAEFMDKKLWEMGAFKDVEASQEAFQALQ